MSTDRLGKPVDVVGEDLLLRPYQPSDVPQIAAVADDPEIARWNRVAQPTAEEWVARRADWSTGEHASWVIADPAAPEVVRGAISLHHIDFDQLGSEAGYWVGPAHRGHHLASRALRLASRFGFETLGLRRIHLFHAVGNEASCAVATRSGFLYEGTHRQSFRFGDGVWHDEHCHARLSTDSG